MIDRRWWTASAVVAVLLATPQISGASQDRLPGNKATATEGCQGHTATIVGTPDVRHLRGTTGPDVIITGGAGSVRALAGDDVVCVTGRTRDVATGKGNDRVRTSNGRTKTYVDLGRGNDTFSGGTRPDTVSPGQGTDRVTTGGGDDEYEEFGVLASDDVIDLGSGDDRAATPPNPTGSLDGGAGANEFVPVVNFDLERGPWTFDNVAETGISAEGTRFVWRNFRAFTFASDFDGLTFVGSALDERVSLHQFLEFGPRLKLADMGVGDDRVTFGGTLGDAHGGPGRDRLDVVDFDDDDPGGSPMAPAIAVDLGVGVLRAEGVRRDVISFEDLLVGEFARAELRGSGRGNSITVGRVCWANMAGQGGGDRLVARPRGGCPQALADFFGVPRRILAYGNSGNDELKGRRSPDLLVGGPGRDTADGRAGLDRCLAEVRRRCERGGVGEARHPPGST